MTPSTSIFSAPAPSGASLSMAGASLSTAELFQRIDEMRMSVHDRERAKATLRTAESIAEGLGLVVTAMRSLIARIAPASTPRSTLRNSPAPR